MPRVATPGSRTRVGCRRVPVPRVPSGTCDIGRHVAALPRDHAYANLAEVAAEIPEAVRVMRRDGRYGGSQCNGVYVGPSRPDPESPWTGPKLPLDQPGDGFVIAVASPTEWTPRRR